MKIGQIFGWLFIFIVGGLIVSFLIYPETFQSFKTNIKSITAEVIKSDKLIENNSSPSIIKIIPSEMEEYGFWKDLQKSCAYIESVGESEGVSNMKQKVCREACGKRDLEYYSDDCEKDLLVCYCKN